MADRLTRRQRLHLALAASAGAEYLDDHAIPGWPVVIASLLPNIRMQEGNSCIVGTLLKTGFLNGVEGAFTEDRFVVWVERNKVQDAELGFNLPKNIGEEPENDGDINWRHTPTGAVWSALLEAWSVEAHDRLNEDLIIHMESKTLDQIYAIEDDDESYDLHMKRLTAKREQAFTDRSQHLSAVQKAEEDLEDLRNRTEGYHEHIEALSEEEDKLRAQHFTVEARRQHQKNLLEGIEKLRKSRTQQAMGGVTGHSTY